LGRFRREFLLEELSQITAGTWLLYLKTEPKTIGEALKDENWVAAMHEELNQFIRNDVWFLVPKTDQMNIIRTK